MHGAIWTIMMMEVRPVTHRSSHADACMIDRARSIIGKIDKITAKLCGWNGRNLNHAGRLTLVKSVLTSQAVYFLTALKVPKETLKRD